MSEVVDSIIADLDVRYQKYVAGFDKATAAHERFTKSVPKIGAMGGFTQAEAQQYADRHTKAGETVASVEEKTTARVTRTRKARAAAVKAIDSEELASTTAAAKAKADVEIREAERSARLRAVVDRAAARRANQIAPAVNSSIGATVPRGTSGQRGIPASALNGDAVAEVAAEKQVNNLLADQAVLSSRLGVLKGAERDIIRDQIAELRLVRQLETAGLDDAAIALKLDERRAVVARERALAERKRSDASVTNFASGAGIGRGAGNVAAVAGIATAVGVGVGIEVIQSAIDYGKALDDLSKQLGITVEDLQAYQKLARDSGVETTTLSSAFGQFASNLGRAQQGSVEQSKVFKALGIDIKDFSSAGDALPTVIDRISQLKDPLQRAAIETRLFGEEGRKLDPLLSGGAAQVSALARSLQETGKALSQKEIQELDQTAQKLGEVKNQLQVDFARIVSGNADAIIGLANSFGSLAGSVIGAIGSIKQFNAQKLNDLTGGAANAPVAPGFISRLQTGAEGLFRRAIGAGGRSVQSTSRQVETSTPGELAFLASIGRPTKPVQGGSVNQNAIRNLDTPKPPKGPKGKSAESIAREEEQRTKQFNDQVAQANADFLRAQEQMTASADKRAEIELQLLDTAYKARLADIDSNAKRNKLAGSSAALEDARASELKAAEKLARDANEKAILQDRDLDNQRALTQASATLLDVQAGLLSSQLSVARSVGERRDLELKLLENSKEQERNRLNGIINSSRPGDPAAADAQTRLSNLDADYNRQAGDVRYRNRSAGQQYRDDLPRTAGQITDALDEVKVRGLQSLDDKITDSISKVFKLGGAFGDVANGIIKDLIRIGVQRAIIGPIADALFGKGGSEGGSGGGLGSLVSGIGKLFGGRASGGNVVGGGNYLVGENGPEILNMPSSGRVYPNGQLPGIVAGGGRTTLSQHITIDARNSVIPSEFAGAILSEANSQARQYAKAAGQGAIEAGPARAQRVSTLGT